VKGFFVSCVISMVAIFVASGCSSSKTPYSSPTPTQPYGNVPSIPSTPTLPSITPPSALIKSPTTLDSTDYVVFAWNDLDMHCANLICDEAVLLPPYNTVWAQVIKRGDSPTILTTGLTVEYSVIDNTYFYEKQFFNQF
jgi:hypothetical protein